MGALCWMKRNAMIQPDCYISAPGNLPAYTVTRTEHIYLYPKAKTQIFRSHLSYKRKRKKFHIQLLWTFWSASDL